LSPSRGRCGNEDAAHQEGVEQDAEGDDEAELGEEGEREDASTEKVPARTIPALVITAPVTASARRIPASEPCSIVSSRARAIRKML
jgi:hypothetical protein